ncbi:restriction endonuclease subunit S [Ferruginibacter sp.]
MEGYTKGTIGVLQPRDLPDADNVAPEADMLHLADWEIPHLQKHLLKDGELAVMNKGTRLPVFLYKPEYGPMVATSAFYVLTLKPYLLPQYMQWYLKQPVARNYFMANLKGSVIPSVTKAVLGGLPVPVLSLADQQHLCSFDAAIAAEEKLMQHLIKARAEFANSYCEEYIQNHIQ